MIVVSDTTPLISLLKIGRLDLPDKLFGLVYVPQAVYSEVIKVMGTIGVLMVAYEERELTAMEARGCIEILQKNGRHISQLYYERLLNMLND